MPTAFVVPGRVPSDSHDSTDSSHASSRITSFASASSRNSSDADTDLGRSKSEDLHPSPDMWVYSSTASRHHSRPASKSDGASPSATGVTGTPLRERERHSPTGSP